MIIKGVDIVPRVNINISEELKDYFEELSKETGASQSALMAIALKDYIEQKKALNNLEFLLNQVKKLDDK